MLHRWLNAIEPTVGRGGREVIVSGAGSGGAPPSLICLSGGGEGRARELLTDQTIGTHLGIVLRRRNSTSQHQGSSVKVLAFSDYNFSQAEGEK